MSIEETIEDRVSPKEMLKKRGGKYDGAGFFPQVPDFLGYFVGFLLIWLMYTGYGAVVGVFTESKDTVVALSAKAKREAVGSVVRLREGADSLLNERIENTLKTTNVESARARLKRTADLKPSERVKAKDTKNNGKSWTAQKLVVANKYIDDWSAQFGKAISELLNDDLEDLSETREPQGAAEQVFEGQNGDSLDRF